MSSQHAPCQAATSTFSMGLGLAAILGERDLLSSKDDNKPDANNEKVFNPNPNRFETLVSDAHFNSANCKVGNCYTVPPSGTKTSPTKVNSVPSNGEHFKSETQHGEKFMAKIKNTGYSLYGYLGSWGHSSTSTTMTTSTTSTTPVVTGSVPNVTVISTTEDSKSSAMSSVLGQGVRGGMLGALTSFKRNGIL